MAFPVRLLSPSNISGDTGWLFEGEELPAVDEAVTVFSRRRDASAEVVTPLRPRSCAAWVLTVDRQADPAIRALRLD